MLSLRYTDTVHTWVAGLEAVVPRTIVLSEKVNFLSMTWALRTNDFRDRSVKSPLVFDLRESGFTIDYQLWLISMYR